MKHFTAISKKSVLILALLISFSSVFAQSIKKGPYLIYEDTNTEMKVVWQDNATSTDIIKWGTTTSYSDGSANSTEYGTDHQHAYTINGLTPGTKYFYQVETTGLLYNGSFYAAANSSNTSLKFLAYGDTRTYPNDHNLVAQEIISTYTADPEYQSVLISMGDLVNDGNLEADWSEQFFETGLPYINSMFANIPYQSCMGNHEGTGVLFQKYFPYNYQANRYYSYEYGPAIFIVLDQYVSYSPGSAQYIWLENLLSTTTKAWKILYFHEPGWTAAGGHGNNANIQNYIQPLCEQYGVHITFAGHNHYYSRAEVTLNNTTVQHITTGGGGAPLRTPDPTEPYIVTTSSTHHFCKINIVDDNIMNVEVVDKNGAVIDEFTVNQTNNISPSVSLTTPADNTHFESPQSIIISADATDSDGTIAQVEFFVDGSSVGTDNTSPYSVNWTIPSNGTYSITAKATDDLSAFKTSAPVGITVGIYTESVSSRIISGSDDVEESDAGVMYLTSTDIELVFDTYNTAGNQTVGLRFTSLGIPQGVTISNAYIQFTVDEVSTIATDLTIFGDSSDDSPVFTSTANNVSERNKTTVSVNWIPPAWNTVGAAGTDQQTPDLSNIIQEIVNIPAFSQTSAISLIITGTGKRTAKSYEGVAGSSALLTIDYTTAAGNNLPEFTSNPVIESNATEDIAYSSSIADNASDLDGDNLTFSKVSGPSWLTIAADGSLLGTPLNNDVGLNTWTVKVDDGNGGTDQAELKITVINVNDSPIFTSDPVVEIDATENASYSSSIADDASDVDVGDNLTFSKILGPDWLTVATNGDLSGTPLIGDVESNSWTVQVSDGNGGTDETTLKIEVKENIVVTYCNSYSQNFSGEYISKVVVGNLSNSSGGSAYSDFTSQIFDADPGATYNISLTPWKSNPSRKESWRVWIDYNADGDFDDTDELVFSTDRKRNPVTETFTIPAGASGKTRMRVAMAYNTTSIDACGTISYGEVEDYSIQIGEAVTLPPVADFSANNTTIEVGESVQFTDLSTNNPTSWSWSFPDGTPATSTVQNPLITYNSTGVFNVILTATNSDGSDEEQKTGYVTVTGAVPHPPVANFTADKTSVNVGESVQFTDISTNNPTSWSWTFAGGTPSSSTSQNQTVTYNSVGTFDVTLTATNTDGSDEEQKTGYITVSEPSGKYCTSAGGSTSLEWIKIVTIDGVTNNSGDDSGYGDHLAFEFNLSPGSNSSITLTPGFSNKSQREFWRIWIDFDNNFVFDSGELVLAINNFKSTVSGNISIPSGLTGTTRMRISMKQGSAPLSCGDFSRGEVEDYTIDFGGADQASNKSATIQPSISVDRSSEGSFNAYPNPATDKLHIHFEGWEGIKEIRLFDMTGKTVYLKTVSDEIFEIDVSVYPKGIYLLDVNNGILRENKKIRLQ